MQVTIRAIIDADDALIETVRTANQACQHCLDVGFKHKVFNKTRLHHLTYKNLRALYPKLNSSLVTAVRDQASDMLKRQKLKRHSTKRSLSSVRLNHNTFRYYDATNEIGLSTIAGRKRYAVRIPSYFRQYPLTSITAANISIKKNKAFVFLVTDIPDVKIHKPKNVVGIDRGAYNPAVTSDACFFDSKRLRAIKGRYRYLRGALQRAGTRSAKRHLRKLSGRERRFVADTNHVISKKIVNGNGDAFGLERLSVMAMKMRAKRMRVRENRLIGNWSPAQLAFFIEYKARRAGKGVIYVNSAYTSQCCNRCGDIRKPNRKGREFRCCVCGFCLHSDLNAARNIATLAKGVCGRLSVNEPIVTRNDAYGCPRDVLQQSVVASPAFLMRGS